MLALSQLIGAWTGTSRLADLADRVAGRSRLQAWQRVAERVPDLNSSEARGYVRARAGGIIREEAARLAEQEGGLARRWQSKIEAAALEALTASLLAQLHQPRRSQFQRRAA